MKTLQFYRFALSLLCTVAYQSEVSAQDWIYKARSGDTLWDLCLEYTNKDNCWLILGKYNEIDQAKGIRVGSEIRIPQSWLITPPVVGQVAGVQGEVTYQSKVGEEPVPLVAGQSLMLGGTIVTSQGSARISLGEKSTILIRQNSTLILDSLSAADEPDPAAELKLKQGAIQVDIEPNSATRFEVKTPSAIAAVRGTGYRLTLVDELDQPTRTEVISGAVKIQGENEATLDQGFGILAYKGAPLSEPRALLEAPQFDSPSVESPLPVAARWSANPQAVAWQVDLMGGPEKNILIASYRTPKPEILIADVPLACYQLVVRAIDDAGFQGWDNQLPLCVLAPLPAPEIVPEEKPERYWVHTIMASVFFILVLL